MTGLKTALDGRRYSPVNSGTSFSILPGVCTFLQNLLASVIWFTFHMNFIPLTAAQCVSNIAVNNILSPYIKCYINLRDTRWWVTTLWKHKVTESLSLHLLKQSSYWSDNHYLSSRRNSSSDFPEGKRSSQCISMETHGSTAARERINEHKPKDFVVIKTFYWTFFIKRKKLIYH